MADKKFSQFDDGAEMQIGDTPVGLRPSDPTKNFKFDFPGVGIKDSSGNYLFQYTTAGASAVNYLKLINSVASTPVELTANGSDANISISIFPKGTGNVILDLLTWPGADGTANQAIVTNGAGILDFASVALVTVPTTDNAIARFNGTGGALQNSGVIISDGDAVSGITRLDVDNLRLDGNTLTSTDVNGAINITPNGLGAINLHSVSISSVNAMTGLTLLDVDNLRFDNNSIIHIGDLDTQIIFGTDVQSFETGGTIRLDLTNSGMRLGSANARVTTILTDTTMAAAADTNLYTGLALKTYIDAVARGLNIQPACLCATTAALTATYNNGASGVGATLTNAGAMAAFSVDGVSPAVGKRVLVKNQASALQNGIYTVTTVGSGAVNWVLTRATDFDDPSEIEPGDLVIVVSGTVQAQSSWLQIATVTTVGTDPITFIQFSAAIPVSLTNGGTGASLSASNGGIFYSNATTGAILAGTATARQMLQSGASTTPAWSTATYPATTTAQQLLYSSSTNVVGGLTTTASSMLTANASGNLSWATFEENVAWTPVGFGSTTAGTPTGVFNGRYSKYGRMVFGSAQMVFTSLTGMVGDFRVDGLPYTVSNAAVYRSGVWQSYKANMTVTTFPIAGTPFENTTTMRLYRSNADATPVVIGDLSATTGLYFGVQYLAST